MQPPSLQMKQQEASILAEESVPMRRRNIVSPWEDIAEFEEVRNHIYGTNSNPYTWKQAVVELRIWANRRRSLCPAAIFATLTMLEAKLYEENTFLGESELQSLYAFALIRFFNFMSSTMQSYNMRSMYNTATELGLASFVVDLRHICAHGTELPELLLLRQTTNYCLNWLYTYYWSVQTQKMVDVEAKCLQDRSKALSQATQQVEELLNIFDIAFECHLTGCTTSKNLKERLRGQRLSKLKAYWKTKNVSTVRETFDAIVTDMIALTKCGNSQKCLAKIFAKSFLKMNYFFNFVENHTIEQELPDILDVVQNLFRFLAVCNIVETVLCELFGFAENLRNSETQRTGATFWIKQIIIGMSVFVSCKKEHYKLGDVDAKVSKLKQSAIYFGQISKSTRQTYKNCGVDLKRTIIFGDSFQRPWVWSFNRSFLQKRVKAINKQTRTVLQSLINLIKPNMSSYEIEKLNKITTAYLDQIDVLPPKDISECASSDKIYTMNDLCSDSLVSNPSQAEKKSSDSTLTSGWKRLQEDDFDWSNCPIGRLPWH